MTGRILELSLAADPLNPVDGGESGGQQILVREMVRGLGLEGVGADVVSYHQGTATPIRSTIGHLGRVVRIGSGMRPLAEDADWVEAAPKLTKELLEWIAREGSEYSVVHSHFWVSGMVAQEISQKLQIPWIHSPYKMAKWIHRNGLPVAARRIEVERSLIKQVSAVVVSYLDEGELVHADAPRIPLYVIPPAVNPTAFFIRDAGPVLKGLNLSRRPLVYVGRLSEGRGLQSVLEAMANRSLPDDLVLLVVGGRPGEVVNGRPRPPALAALKDALGGHVRFLGAMPHGAVAQYLSAAQVMLSPNQGPTLGMAVVEALACGRPVVGSRVTGVADWVTSGVDGLLYNANDIAGMVDGALSLWQDPQRARTMGGSGYEKVHRHHSVEYITGQLLRVYEEVMAGAGVETGIGY